MKNYYQMLGVHRQSKPEEIRAIWKLLASNLHPDKPGGNAEKFVSTSEAYRVLRNRQERNAYDKSLEFLGKTCKACSSSGFRVTGKNIAALKQIPCRDCGGCGYVDFVEI